MQSRGTCNQNFSNNKFMISLERFLKYQLSWLPFDGYYQIFTDNRDRLYSLTGSVLRGQKLQYMYHDHDYALLYCFLVHSMCVPGLCCGSQRWYLCWNTERLCKYLTDFYRQNNPILIPIPSTVFSTPDVFLLIF